VLFAALEDNERGYGTLDVTIDENGQTTWWRSPTAMHVRCSMRSNCRRDDHAEESVVRGASTLRWPWPKSRSSAAPCSTTRRATTTSTRSAPSSRACAVPTRRRMYWMAKMIYAGESPRFIFRRMLILAGEDVGMADPNAIQVVNACAQPSSRWGSPKGASSSPWPAST